MTDTVGIDQSKLGERFEQVLGLSLRETDRHLVIAASRPTERVYKVVRTAFESGHNVTLVSQRKDAPPVDRWLWE